MQGVVSDRSVYGGGSSKVKIILHVPNVAID